MFGRMLNEKLGKAHFWLTFVTFYGVFLGMHFTGLGGQPRRYYSFTNFEYLQPFENWNVFITLCAFVLGASQFVFLVNFVWSLLRGPKSESNPWHATTLEWTTSSPAPHGNWGAALPEVHRWAYDYSVPGAPEDYTSQTVPAREVPVTL